MLLMRKHMEELMLQMASICAHLQQNPNPLLEGQTSATNTHREHAVIPHTGEIQSRDERLDFSTFHGEDPLG